MIFFLLTPREERKSRKNIAGLVFVTKTFTICEQVPGFSWFRVEILVGALFSSLDEKYSGPRFEGKVSTWVFYSSERYFLRYKLVSLFGFPAKEFFFRDGCERGGDSFLNIKVSFKPFLLSRK